MYYHNFNVIRKGSKKLLTIKSSKSFFLTPSTSYMDYSVLYKLLFSRGFYFREFREPDPRENFHFNSCLFIVMTTSEKSRN